VLLSYGNALQLFGRREDGGSAVKLPLLAAFAAVVAATASTADAASTAAAASTTAAASTAAAASATATAAADAAVVDVTAVFAAGAYGRRLSVCSLLGMAPEGSAALSVAAKRVWKRADVTPLVSEAGVTNGGIGPAHELRCLFICVTDLETSLRVCYCDANSSCILKIKNCKLNFSAFTDGKWLGLAATN
jgi:hypothetical protein